MTQTAPPYPSNLNWKPVLIRLHLLNQVLTFIGAVSQHLAERSVSLASPTTSLFDHYIQMQCAGVFGMGLGVPLMLWVARRAWRLTPDVAVRHARHGLFGALPMRFRLQVLLTPLALLPVSTWAAQQLYAYLAADLLNPWLTSAAPSLATMAFANVYAGLLLLGLEYFHDRSTHSEARAKLAQQLSAQAQLDLLRSQLDPHMLFNTLSNLFELIDENPAQARAMLSHLIDFLRSTLLSSRATEHPLSEEVRLAEAYLSLMQMRMGSRLQHHIDLPADLSTAQVPAMLLQPLVENAIKHGLERDKNPGWLKVKAWQEGAQLILQVTNSGKTELLDQGHPMPSQHSGGFGLQYVHDRLQALHGAQASLELRHLAYEDRTEVIVRLPLSSSTTRTLSPKHP